MTSQHSGRIFIAAVAQGIQGGRGCLVGGGSLCQGVELEQQVRVWQIGGGVDGAVEDEDVVDGQLEQIAALFEQAAQPANGTQVNNGRFSTRLSLNPGLLLHQRPIRRR